MARRSLEQVDAEARAEFAVQLALATQPLPDISDLQEKLNAEYARLLGGKVPAHPDKRGAKLRAIGVDPDSLISPFTSEAALRIKTRDDSVKAAEERLRELAPDVILHPVGNGWTTVQRISKSAYSTQTQPLHYAEVCAKLYAEGIAQHGVIAVIANEPHDYAVNANVFDPLEVVVLCRLPGLPMRQWYKRCLQLGANPCVFNPYLPYGFWQEKFGLDNFGNDMPGWKG